MVRGRHIAAQAAERAVQGPHPTRMAARPWSGQRAADIGGQISRRSQASTRHAEQEQLEALRRGIKKWRRVDPQALAAQVSRQTGADGLK